MERRSARVLVSDNSNCMRPVSSGPGAHDRPGPAQLPAHHRARPLVVAPGRPFPPLFVGRRLVGALLELEHVVQHADGDDHEHEEAQAYAQHDDDHVVPVFGFGALVDVGQEVPDRRPIVRPRRRRSRRPVVVAVVPRRRRPDRVRPSAADGGGPIGPGGPHGRGRERVVREIQPIAVRQRADLQPPVVPVPKQVVLLFSMWVISDGPGYPDTSISGEFTGNQCFWGAQLPKIFRFPMVFDMVELSPNC